MDYQILINSCTNIPETSSRQVTAYVPASPNFCFCTIWGKQNNEYIAFRFNAMQYHYLIHITHI